MTSKTIIIAVSKTRFCVILMCGLYVFFKKRSRKSRVKDWYWAGFLLFADPHRHVATGDWFNFFFFYFQGQKKLKKKIKDYISGIK